MAPSRISSPLSVVVTGASRGLGAALARAYAAPGVQLAISARREKDLLAVVARDCEAKGARVIAACFDAADAETARKWLSAVDRERPIDLLIVNAGLFSGNRAGGVMEPVESSLAQVSANLAGAVATVDAVLPGMRRRRRGQIALVASLAALQPLADAPAYSASKAGLAAYGEALRELLAPEGISVATIYPGNIETAQTAHHSGALPLMMSPERAAAVIKARLARGRTSIAFPGRLVWLIRAGRLLPWRLRALAMRPFRFHVGDQK
jgi:short-subunit dehydrogenase